MIAISFADVVSTCFVSSGVATIGVVSTCFVSTGVVDTGMLAAGVVETDLTGAMFLSTEGSVTTRSTVGRTPRGFSPAGRVTTW